MPVFCHQVRYTSSAWSRVLQNTKDRFASLRVPIESLGGKIQSLFFSQGSYDVLAITEFPDGFSPAALDIAFSAGGEVATIHTTRLLDASQIVDAVPRSLASSQPAPLPRSLAATNT